MCLKINWSVNRPDLGLARELLASGYGLLLPPAAPTPPPPPPPPLGPSNLNLGFKISGGGGGGGGGGLGLGSPPWICREYQNEILFCFLLVITRKKT